MIKIEQGDSWPFVLVEPELHKLEIKGNSFVSNPKQFFERVISWGEDLRIAQGKTFQIRITMGYFSTSNIQLFNALFKKMNNNNPGKIEIVFALDKEEEEDMEETILSIVFNSNIPYKTEYI